LFGGDSAAGNLGDTWTWDGITWTQQTPSMSPSPRGLSSIAWDNSVRRVVLFGGNSGPGQNLFDTWIWNGATWLELIPDAVPVGRFAAPMDFDYVTRGLVLFGGFGTTTLDDTRLFFTSSN
jgi:hypothetical protein